MFSATLSVTIAQRAVAYHSGRGQQPRWRYASTSQKRRHLYADTAHFVQRQAFPQEKRSIVGGRVAGLLPARVLADHFDRVTLIDATCFPQTARPARVCPRAATSMRYFTAGWRL